ncbi:hypothetical protein FRB99_007442 [Tulasnella sp. 403]|nr:hypothetical protein FRB99_007442 [Tulasnella sp. 403]
MSNPKDLKSLEQELAKSLTALKPVLLRRSCINFPKKNSEIGVGGYGTVHRATLKRTIFAPKVTVAVKRLFTTGQWENKLQVAIALVQELLVWVTLSHPNILPLLGFHLSRNLEEAWLVSPFATNGNLYKFIETKHPTIHIRLELAKDTAKGLEYLHTRSPPICHGDIKSLNVLVADDGRAMLCDFGVSKTTTTPSSSRVSSSLTVGGTLRYWSPELFVPESLPTLESDVWAWGCLFLEIVTGRAPYDDIPLEGRVIHQITQNVPPATLSSAKCPEHVKTILRQCWSTQPESRPTMTQLLGFLTGKLLSILSFDYPLSPQRRTANSDADSEVLETNFDHLERELNEVLKPMEGHRMEPGMIIFPKSETTLGVGGFGTVYRATIRRGQPLGGSYVAVKKLRAAGGRDKCLRLAIALIRELAVWASLHHANVISLIGFHLSEHSDEAWLISPYMAQGNISSFLVRMRPNEDVRVRLALDTASGLEYLHSLDPPVCHGDIKSLNVLITDERRAILCDFGLAKSMESMPSGLTTSTFNQGGSLPYESPELLTGTSLRAPESDVWAWGCLLQEIFSSRIPYYWANNPGAIVKFITEDIPPAPLNELRCPPRVMNLLSLCWRREPSDRPRMERCVKLLSGSDEVVPVDGERTSENTEALRLTRSDILFDEALRIGSGSLGIIYRATLARVGREPSTIAIKKLFPVENKTERSRLINYIGAASAKLAELKNLNIVSFLGFYIDPADDGEILLAYDFVAGGNLSDHLQTRSLNDSQKLQLGTEVANGLLYLHTRQPPIYHGNLHPRNILIDPQGKALLSDYGVRTMLEETQVTLGVPVGSGNQRYRYLSPEHLLRKQSSLARKDVWSWACVFLEILTERVPYEAISNVNELRETVERGELPADIDALDCPVRSRNLLGLCLQTEVELRPSVSDVVAYLTGKKFKYDEFRAIPARGLKCLKLSRDGTSLAAGFDKSIEIYDCGTGELRGSLPLRAPSTDPIAMQYSPCGRFLLAAMGDYTILVWDIGSRQLESRFSGHTDTVWALDILESIVVTGSEDRSARLWSRGSSNAVHTTELGERVFSAAIFPDGDLVALGLDRAGIKVLDMQNWTVIASFGDSAVWSLRTSLDSKWLFSGGSNYRAQSWAIEGIRTGLENIPLISFKGPTVSVFSKQILCF